MQKGKRQKLNEITIDGENEAPDLISKLPDELLHSIISFLPTKEAVATSVYSKRWSFLWKSLSRLYLDLYQINNHRARSLAIADKIVSSLSFSVDFFHLHHSPRTWVRSDYMLRWIDFLKNEKKLKGISLSCDKITAINFIRWFRVSKLGERIIHKFVIPKGSIFKGRFLQFVELNEYVLKNGLPFKGCVNIKTLKLGGCILADNTLVETLKSCKELEKLTLRHCSFMSTDVSIRHQKLKLLEIFHIQEQSFCLISERLDKLVLEDCVFSTTKSRILCPNLQVLQTNVASLPSLWGVLTESQQGAAITFSLAGALTVKRRINMG
ncbi:F-box protein At1g80960-like [Solanum tuberosum]|uniref:F-box protein At1g80960-like n=1 Tax=Solanum tuberosum TaxID=4113 RepID=UPI0003D25088|nr:PREDICTED: F-box protein At1g80960-like [Solanum tuberosum]